MDTGDHWLYLAAHFLFTCHNHLLTAYNEPYSNNYRFLWVNTILFTILFYDFLNFIYDF